MGEDRTETGHTPVTGDKSPEIPRSRKFLWTAGGAILLVFCCWIPLFASLRLEHFHPAAVPQCVINMKTLGTTMKAFAEKSAGQVYPPLSSQRVD